MQFNIMIFNDNLYIIVCNMSLYMDENKDKKFLQFIQKLQKALSEPT